jgi:two-component system cell cycle sensor histidine kinase/response regulator CckA
LPLAPGADDGSPGGQVVDEELSEGLSVLVVDDDDDLRRVLVEELSRLGHRTSQASTGTGALEQIDHPVDVLICDVQLPDLDGHEVATGFWQRHQDLAVVYISGAPAAQVRDLLPEDAVLLLKPFAIGDLVAAIEDGSKRT